MIRREKYLKTASRLRQVVVKQGQKINADKRISLEAERAYLKKELAKLASAGQRAFAQPNYLAA